MESSAEDFAVVAPRWMDVYVAAKKTKKKADETEEPELPEQEEAPAVESTPEDDTIDLNDESDEVSSPLADEPEEQSEKKEPEQTSESNKEPSTEPEKQQDPKAKEPKKPKRLVKGLLLGFLFLLILAGSAAAFASQKSVHRASIAGLSIGVNTSAAQLTSQLDEKVSTFQITVQYPSGKTKTIPLSKTGITVDTTASANAAIAAQKPNNLLNRLKWWQTEDVPLVLHIDDKELNKFIKNVATKTITPTRDASLRVKNGQVVIKKEKSGTAVTLANPEETFKSIVANLKTETVVLAEQTVSPEITSENIQESKQKVESILAANVVFDIDGHVYSPSRSSIGAWIDISPVEEDSTIDIDVNSGKVLEYLDEVAEPLVQPPVSQIVLKQSDGTTKILIPGRNGIDITNKKALASKVANTVINGKDITVDATVKHASFKTINAKAYPKFFVVDLTNKRMYAYAQTKLLRTFLISAGAPATPTPVGTHKIMSKVRIEDMEGANADGSRYFQADVQFVNYFAAGGYAIHGNHWRPLSYFGNINSSHGCVGIVNSDAEWIYNWAPIGTPVIVHN